MSSGDGEAAGWCEARCGLPAVRVGEASHPGLPRADDVEMLSGRNNSPNLPAHNASS